MPFFLSGWGLPPAVANRRSKRREFRNMQTILLVEDKDSMAQMLKETLESAGYSTVIARDGLEGIRVLKDGNFDLVLSDLKLPKRDGIEVLRASKSEDQLTPVIVMTAFGTIENAVAAMK